MPALRSDQAAIVANPATIKFVAMGRRWGKTYMAGVYALTCADRGAAVAWVAPTYKNTRPLWRFCESHTAQVASRLRINRSERIMEFPSGGSIAIYTADNDVGLRGEAFDVVIVDEAAQVREETYTDVILPTLADRDGHCMLITTPKGRNWFYREWVNADGHDAARFQAPSSANPMPTIRRAFDLAKSRVSDRTFRQEWLAEFVDDGGGVFRRVSEAATATAQERGYGNYVIGADWGRTNDATVFVVLDIATRSMVAMDRMVDTNYALQTMRLKALWQRFNRPAVVAESNSMGGPVVESLQRDGVPVIPFATTNASKMQIIDGLALAFEQGAIRILPDTMLLSELQSYESDRTPTGLVTYSAPDGMHDDTVIALALAWHGATHMTSRRARSGEY